MKIREALIESYLALFPELAGKTEFENTPFTSPVDAVWAGVFYTESDRRPATTGAGGEDQVDGFLQIDFNVPRGTGEAAMLALMKRAQDYYVAGRDPHKDGVVVHIRRSTPSVGREVGAHYRKSLTVYFYARVRRDTL